MPRRLRQGRGICPDNGLCTGVTIWQLPRHPLPSSYTKLVGLTELEEGAISFRSGPHAPHQAGLAVLCIGSRLGGYQGYRLTTDTRGGDAPNPNVSKYSASAVQHLGQPCACAQLLISLR